MSEPPFHGRRAVYAGDDVTDEAAFEEINRMGGRSIRVGGQGETAAAHAVPDVVSLLAWLESLPERIGVARRA